MTLSQLAALALVETISPPNAARTLARCILALGTFIGMAWWLRSNRPAFDLQEWCECAPRTMTVRVIKSRRAEPLGRIEPPASVTAEADELVPV